MFRQFGIGLAVATLSLAASFGVSQAQEAGEAEMDAAIAANDSDAGAMALARQQVAVGHLSGAAATLQRSLLVRPASSPVRAYYATILCRLGDPWGGRHQLSLVGPSDAAGVAEARQTCGGSSDLSSSSAKGVSGRVSLGIGYDTDAVGALLTQLEVPGFPAVSDEGTFLFGSGQINTRFATSERGHAYAGATAYGRGDISGPDADYLVGAVRAGYDFNLGDRDRRLSAGLYARTSWLSGDEFLTELGVQGEYGISDANDGRWTVNVEAVDQSYEPTVFTTFRDGGRYDLAFAYRYTPTPDRATTIGVALEVKDAELDQFAYRGWRIFAAGQWPIADNGTYMTASGVLRSVDFEDVPLTPDRRETRLFLRTAVGIPLPHEGLFAEAGLTFATRNYNASSSIADYQSTGAEVRLVYVFGQ